MEPVVRDSLLLLFCWMVPIGMSFVWIGRNILRILRKITPPAIKKIPFLKRLARIEFRPIRFALTVGKMKITQKTLFLVYLAILVVVTGLCVQLYFFSKPYVIWQSQENGTMYADETNSISILFDKPINKKELEVVTLPEDVEAQVLFVSPFEPILESIKRWTNISIPTPYYTKIIITPKHSIPYETGIVFYLRNVTDLGGKSGRHEQALNFGTPDFPEIKTTYPRNNETDIHVDSPIKLEFSTEVTKSLNIKVVSVPEVSATFAETGSNQGQITFAEPLEQGTTYTMTLVREKRKLELESKTLVTNEDVEGDLTLTFKTVTPAGTKSILPTGTSVHPSSNIVLTFTEPMETESVESNIKIEPAFEYEATWDETKQIFTINPKEHFPKATKYTVTLGTDIKTQKSGTLPKEIVHTFETLGNVKVTGFSPRSGSTSNSVSSAITVTFDQAVDHASAQSLIVVSPGFAATYSWNGNAVTIKPKAGLVYSTKYTVTVKPGIKAIDGINSKDTFTYSFSTRAQVVKIYVPLYNQPGYFDCNLTATSMALKAKGVSASVDQIRAYVGAVWGTSPPSYGNPNSDWVDNYGVHWDPLASYIRYRGRGAEVKSGWSLAGIASEIQKGNPVIVFWYNGVTSTTPPNSWYASVGAKPGMHSVVVYGFAGSESNPSYLYVQDPWYAYRKSYYTASQFLSKWNYMGRRAIVVK